MEERLAIAGSGAIACGLAATAARAASVVLLARSGASAARASERLDELCQRLDDAPRRRIHVESDADALDGTSFVIEAIVEDLDAKTELLAELSGRLGDQAILATTTSALAVDQLAAGSGRPERFVGFHVFNPVPKMELVELAFPPSASDATRARAWALAHALGKTAVEVPLLPGFVVNRLLFPYLFGAVRLLEEGEIEPKGVDTCMRLGAGHPMGPLALLDFVGLDVALAIGEAVGLDVPARVRDLVAAGALGRKSGQGFYEY